MHLTPSQLKLERSSTRKHFSPRLSQERPTTPTKKVNFEKKDHGEFVLVEKMDFKPKILKKTYPAQKTLATALAPGVLTHSSSTSNLDKKRPQSIRVLAASPSSHVSSSPTSSGSANQRLIKDEQIPLKEKIFNSLSQKYASSVQMFRSFDEDGDGLISVTDLHKSLVNKLHVPVTKQDLRSILAEKAAEAPKNENKLSYHDFFSTFSPDTPQTTNGLEFDRPLSAPRERTGKARDLKSPSSKNCPSNITSTLNIKKDEVFTPSSPIRQKNSMILTMEKQTLTPVAKNTRYNSPFRTRDSISSISWM